ncbi:MAG: hypothetical protein AB2A00_36840 [Myxococcota bacterium]
MRLLVASAVIPLVLSVGAREAVTFDPGPPNLVVPTGFKPAPAPVFERAPESDVHLWWGEKLLILSATHGLRVLEVPGFLDVALTTTLATSGRPVALLADASRVHAVTTTGDRAPRTVVTTIDMSQPQPATLGEWSVSGRCDFAKMFGQALVLSCELLDEPNAMQRVLSLRQQDGAWTTVESHDFPYTPDGEYTWHAASSDDALVLATALFSLEETANEDRYRTRITRLDFSSRDGASVRGEITFPGRPLFFHEEGGLLRAVGQPEHFSQEVLLTLVDAHNPATLEEVSRLTVSGSPWAAVMRGDDVLLASTRLQWIEVHDPTHPVEREMDPTGDVVGMPALIGNHVLATVSRAPDVDLALLALEGERARLVSTLAVSPPWDSSNGWMPFKNILGTNLVFHPIQRGTDTGMRLVEMRPDSLLPRGELHDVGWVEHVTAGLDGRLVTTSDARVILVDAANPDQPREVQRVEFARTVLRHGALSNGSLLQTSWDEMGNTVVTVRRVDELNDGGARARKVVPMNVEHMFMQGDQAHLVELPADAASTSSTAIHVVTLDASNPDHLQATQDRTITSNGPLWGPYGESRPVLMVGTTLVVAAPVMDPSVPANRGGCACGYVALEPRYHSEVVLLDTADPAAVASTLTVSQNEWITSLVPAADSLFVSVHTWADNGQRSITRLERWDLSAPQQPRRTTLGEVPGPVISVVDGRLLLSLEPPGDEAARTQIHALRATDEGIQLQRTHVLSGRVTSVGSGEGVACMIAGAPFETKLRCLTPDAGEGPPVAVEVGPLSSETQVVTVQADKVLLADHDGVSWFDLSENGTPTARGSQALPGSILDVTVVDNIAVVAAGAHGAFTVPLQ